tara:strand:+ start:6673 stop:6918 length:246 start_codon:yes stop_codon:yes gene_type:complete
VKFRIVEINSRHHPQLYYIVESRFMFSWRECDPYLDSNAVLIRNHSLTVREAENWIIAEENARQYWFDANNPKREIVKYIK